MQNLLLVHYGPGPTSVTAKVTEKIRPIIQEKYNLIETDLLIDKPEFFTKESMGAYVSRNYMSKDVSETQEKTLEVADKFAKQVLESDVLVMVFPMYNFAIPGAVKTWIDNVCQAKTMFKYSEYGPEGLSKIQKAIIIPVTGSTPQNASNDFITPYMNYILKFIGVKEIIFKGIYGTKFFLDAIDQRVDEVVKEVEEVLS